MSDRSSEADRSKGTAALQDLIITSDLRPGDRLPNEDELAATLQIGRNSVREAVRELRALGIVDIRHPQGTFLRDASFLGLERGLEFWMRIAARDGLESVQPIAEVRNVLEVNLIGEVVDRLGVADFRAAEQQVREMERAAERGRYSPKADQAFHEAIFRPLQNWMLSYLLSTFFEVYFSVRHLVDRQGWSPVDNAQLHRDIFVALRSRDPVEARVAMERHFQHSAEAIEAAAAPSDRKSR